MKAENTKLLIQSRYLSGLTTSSIRCCNSINDRGQLLGDPLFDQRYDLAVMGMRLAEPALRPVLEISP